MKSFFVDTTSGLTVGLLDENWNWISYQRLETNKTSTLIHPMLERILKENQLSKEQVKNFIYMAGPGSYTGMRVAEGIAQIFAWQGFQTYSFYHYEVPALIGNQQYFWYANAYKREYFIYHWNGKQGSQELISEKQWDLEQKKQDPQYFCSTNTTEIIHDSSHVVFPEIVKSGIKRPLFYFRNIEDEFKRAAP